MGQYDPDHPREQIGQIGSNEQSSNYQYQGTQNSIAT